MMLYYTFDSVDFNCLFCSFFFFFSSRRRHTRYWRDWSSDVCSSDLHQNNEIGETLPFAGHNAKDFAGAGGTMLFPCLRFRDFRTNVEGEKRGDRTSPEHGAPTERDRKSVV